MSFKKKALEDDDPALADDLDDSVAAPAASDRGGSGPAISKRQFLKGATVGAGSLAAGGVGLNYSTRNARAIAPAIPVAGFAAGAAIAYLMDPDTTPYLGDDRDLSGFTGWKALWDEIFISANESAVADEELFTSIENNLTNSDNVALAKGKAAAITAMNNEESESAASTAMNEAVDEYYSIIEENIIKHFERQLKQIGHLLDRANATNELPVGESPYIFDSRQNSNYNSHSFSTTTITLSDGRTIDFEYLVFDTSNGKRSIPSLWFSSSDGAGGLDHYLEDSGYEGKTDVRAYFTVTDRDDSADTPTVGSNETYLYQETSTTDSDTAVLETKHLDVWQLLHERRTDVINQLAGFVTDVYAEWEPGEIPTEDLVDPITASTELRQNYDGYQAQGAHAAMLGIPTTAEQSVNLTVHTADGDRNIWADIYTEYVPTDGSGNEVGFQSGQTYDPSTWDKPLYIAYEYTEETEDGTTTSTDFVQLDDSFTIDVIEDKEGNEVDSFQTESRTNQTADVSKLQEELDQLREAQLEMQEEAQSGGGGFSFDQFAIGDIPGVATIAMIGAGILLLLNDDD